MTGSAAPTVEYKDAATQILRHVVPPDLQSGLDNLLKIYAQSLLAILLTSVLVLLVIQALKVPVRGYCHRDVLRRWVMQRSRNIARFEEALRNVPSWLPRPPDIPHRATLDGIIFVNTFLSRASVFLPTQLYIKQLENLFKQVIESPGEHRDLLPIVAHGAAMDALVAVYVVDQAARTSPGALAEIGRHSIAAGGVTGQGAAHAEHQAAAHAEPAPEYASAITAAQDNIVSAVERNLDDVQIRVTFKWAMSFRAFSTLAGIYISIILGSGYISLTLGHVLFLFVVGAVAGYFAALISDTASSLGRMRR